MAALRQALLLRLAVAAVAGMSSLLTGVGRPLAVMGEISAALLTALVTGLGGPFPILGEISAALLTALAPSLGCTFPIPGKIARTAAMFGFRIRHC